MIEVELPTALMLYFSTAVLIIFLFWALSHIKGRKKEILGNPYALHVCEYCQFPYLEAAHRLVSRCPQCELLNQTKKN